MDLRSVYSIWSRHAKRYRASWKVNCIPPISEPLIYLLAFGYGMGPLIKEFSYLGKSVPYFTFIAPGMIAVGVLFQSFFEGAYGTYIRIRYQMTWQAMLTAPLTFSEIFCGDLLWAATRGTLAGILTGLTAVALGVYSLYSLIQLLPIILIGSVMFASLGLWTAGVVKNIDQLNIPVFLFVVPMFAFCGTYFPREVLPSGLRFISSMLPLAPLVDLMRLPIATPERPFISLLTLVLWTVIFTYLAKQRLLAKLYQQ